MEFNFRNKEIVMSNWRKSGILGVLYLLIFSQAAIVKAQNLISQVDGPCLIPPNPELVMTFRNPDGGNITVDFDLVGNMVGRVHRGIDLGMGKAYDVYASYSGTIKVKDDKPLATDQAGGKVVFTLDKPYSNYSIKYFHQQLSSPAFLSLQVGQHIAQGQYLGIADGNPVANNEHLHLELWKDGQPIDPKPYFNCKGNYFAGQQSQQPTPVTQGDEGVLHPYQGRHFYPTQGCHSDGWGSVTGVANTCALDFTIYGDSRDTNCGEPAMAPISGNFTNLGEVDQQKNTGAMIDGSRYQAFFLHGDYISSGPIRQGEIFGYEADHGNSSACHWHWSMFDKQLGQWVDPRTLNGVAIPQGAGNAPRGLVEHGEFPDLPIQQIILEIPFDMSGHTEDSSLSVQPTLISAPDVVNTNDGENLMENVPWNGTLFDVRREFILIPIAIVAFLLLVRSLNQFDKGGGD